MLLLEISPPLQRVHLNSFLPQMLLSIMTLQMSNLDVLGKCVQKLRGGVVVSSLGIAYILMLEENANCAGVFVVLVVDVIVGCIKQETTRL